MKLKDTFMSNPICVKSLKYQSINWHFTFLLATMVGFLSHTSENNAEII